MADLRTGVELVKLARELGVPEDRVDFLSELPADALREIRTHVSAGLFHRNEERLRRISRLTGLLPTPITAKIAQLAMGPMLSARIAGVLEPGEAVKLARQLDPAFLAEVSVSLDPQRVAAIVGGLPDSLVVEVGRRLLAAGDHVTLGRFVSVVRVEAALGVVAEASGPDLLQVALFTEDPAALEAVVARLDDGTLADVMVAVGESGAYDDALGLLGALSPESRARFVARVDRIEPAHRDGLVAAVARTDSWPEVLPALEQVDHEVLRALVNVPATQDAQVIDRVLQHAWDLGLGTTLVQLVLALDDAHLAVVEHSTVLRQPALQDWLRGTAGVPERLVKAVLDELHVTG